MKTGFYLGSHHPGWLSRVTVPLFVSWRRLSSVVRHKRATCPWALDSGGYSELSMFGRWETAACDYARGVERASREIGGLEWAAVQDWMTEPHILAKTGLSMHEHQVRTVRSYLELRDLSPEMPWVAVLQGATADDYRRHVDMHLAAGIDLAAFPLVGIGSVCRRQDTRAAEIVVRDLTRQGLRLHGFGVKLGGLARLSGVLASSDSMAWSFQARRNPPCTCGGSSHRSGANCRVYALAWRDRVMRLLEEPSPFQLGLL